jgi:LysM repeat protein
VIAIALVSYSAIGKNRGVSLWLGVSNAAGSSFSQGGNLGTVAVGRSGTILQPVNIPTNPVVAHTPLTYTVGPSDDLKGIAAKFHVSPEEIRWSNPQDLTDTDAVKVGQKLLIPPIAGVVITVQKSDTLQSLAQTWKVQPQTIADFNYLRDPASEIVKGKELVVPGARGPQLQSPDSQLPPATYGWSGIINVGGAFGPVALNHFPYGQCTWYVASWVQIPWMGDAWMWFGNAKSYGWPVGSVPRRGAIMVTWESRYYGHVAYVDQVYADGSWQIQEMNFLGWAVIDQRVIKPGGVPLIGFIYPPQS